MVAESFSQIPSAGRTQTMTDKTAWTPEQFWEYVGGLAGEHEAVQMRDTLQHVGLSLVKTSDYARSSEQIEAYEHAREQRRLEQEDQDEQYEAMEARVAALVSALEDARAFMAEMLARHGDSGVGILIRAADKALHPLVPTDGSK